jgi:hypothetical protein
MANSFIFFGSPCKPSFLAIADASLPFGWQYLEISISSDAAIASMLGCGSGSTLLSLVLSILASN